MRKLILIALGLIAIVAQDNSYDFPVIRTFQSPLAHQGVAVDREHFYTIKTRSIAKHRKDTGKLTAEWNATTPGKIIHLNSGLVVNDRLYCGHSNWPNTPMKSSIEVWDTNTLSHCNSIHFANPPGSCTWVDRYQDFWWVCFAHYDKKGGEKGKGVEMTTLVKYDDQWRPLGSWKFPQTVVKKFAPYSCSGGAWGADGLLYVSGHDAAELYALSIVKEESTLHFQKTIKVNSRGQGIAFDRTPSPQNLYTINRDTKTVIVSSVPISTQSSLPIFLLVGAILFIVFSTTKWKLHPFMALILAAIGFGLLSGMEPLSVVKAVNTGFGGTIGYIGIVILFGTIIGTFLEKSGAAFTLSENALKITGEKNVSLSMGIVGYIVSMPVFCDSGFVILSPLNKALSKRAQKSIAAGAVALALGLYVTHTMVPPTPGPVAAAGILGADLGLVIMWGFAVSFVALLSGWLFAVKYASRFDLADANIQEPTPPPQQERPSVSRSVAPILIPIFLIVLQSIAKLPSKPLGEGVLTQWLIFCGQPVVALLCGVGLALLLPKKLHSDMMSTKGWIGEAIVSAAAIIIITGAGGAFGKVLQSSDIAAVVGNYIQDFPIGILLPFIIAAAIKTAQGSSTVAIITTAGIVAPLLGELQLTDDTAKALVVIAIGAGSMVVSHVNDSYFWVVTQFSNMNVEQGYKLHTLGTLVVGSVAALTVWTLSLFLI
ncbi:GntP family permease [Candidatus Uabimicrobium amorphum]|uniref:Gluconate transporter n=1 Tax=Uabimicrobium amorphum TaxID=2596890 RepID=A0A5S9F1V3_UABAM|nr:GntP family permease [Candidatus Uabimicrobium amorphum]BBM82802.1 gluconate transporter [Candidatus Uabimicrobium amorphum]